MTAPLSVITSPAAALLEDGIDTDIIFPARFLLRMDKAGLGACLFADRAAYTAALRRGDGRPVQIILAGAQFGCGSSREHAVWSLVDFGIRAVIAPSFGEIFASNAARGGLAAIRLPREQITQLADLGLGSDISIDLQSKTITPAGQSGMAFEIPAGDRQALLAGWDEIDIINTAHAQDIEGFEASYRKRRPWLFGGADHG